MKEWNNMKLEDYVEDRYLLLVEENYPYNYFVQPVDKDLQEVQNVQSCATYQGLLIIGNLPKYYFKRLYTKVKGKYYGGAVNFEKQRLNLIELNRAIDLFLKNGFIAIDFNVEKLKELIYERIKKSIENVNIWLSNFGKQGINCDIYRFNSLIVDMNHGADKFSFKKDNVIINILNDHENSFILFKREIFKDKEIRYSSKSIFHHSFLV